jgi:hyperosmotically inducible protein
MFKKQSWVVALVGLTLGAPSAWAGDDKATVDKGDRDDRLEQKVENRLKADHRLGGVDVDVDNGVVTMTGEVASRTERMQAERLARAEGARQIVNKLEVDSDKAAAAIDERAKDRKEMVDTRAEKEKERIDRGAETAKERLERPTTATSTRPAGEKPVGSDRPNEAGKLVRSASDAWLTTKVKTKFAGENLLDKSDLHVDTDSSGVVTLTGTAPSETARARAVEVARTTDGVRKVVDKIVVGAPVVK